MIMDGGNPEKKEERREGGREGGRRKAAPAEECEYNDNDCHDGKESAGAQACDRARSFFSFLLCAEVCKIAALPLGTRANWREGGAGGEAGREGREGCGARADDG